MFSYKTIELKTDGHIATVLLNRPDERNALSTIMLKELKSAFDQLSSNQEIRVVVLGANGKHFSCGGDVTEQEELFALVKKEGDSARKGREIGEKLDFIQAATDSIVNCCKPVIATVHGECVGRGVEILAASDVRVASADAVFSFRCGRLANSFLVAPLVFIPKIVRNLSWLKEMTFSGCRFDVDVAFQNDLVSKVFKSPEEMKVEVDVMAALIAAKSPVAVQANKALMNYARDHDAADTVAFAMTFKPTLFLGKDLQKAVKAHHNKERTEFEGM